MAETFKRLTLRGVGVARTRVGSYTVPASTVAIVIGISIANVGTGEAAATLEHYDGTNYTVLAKAIKIPVGNAFAPAADINKIVLQTGDGLFVTSSVASGLDVIVSILEMPA